MKIGERDFLGNLHPIESTLCQLGINVRDGNKIREMKFYLDLLREEIRMTENFLSECTDNNYP